jgi:hypothetical protein
MVEHWEIYGGKNSSQRPYTMIPIYQITRRHAPVVAITAVRNIRSHEGHHHCKNLAYLNYLAFKKIVFTICEVMQVT